MIIWIWKIWMEMMKISNYRNDENTNFPVIDGKSCNEEDCRH